MPCKTLFSKALNHEVASLRYQLANTNESGQEVIRHLEDTAQDPSLVVDKVTGVNNQWDQLQTKLLELRNRFDFKVSLENSVPYASRSTFHASRFTLDVSSHTSCFTLNTFHLHVTLFTHSRKKTVLPGKNSSYCSLLFKWWPTEVT